MSYYIFNNLDWQRQHHILLEATFINKSCAENINLFLL